MIPIENTQAYVDRITKFIEEQWAIKITDKMIKLNFDSLRDLLRSIVI